MINTRLQRFVIIQITKLFYLLFTSLAPDTVSKVPPYDSDHRGEDFPAEEDWGKSVDGNKDSWGRLGLGSTQPSATQTTEAIPSLSRDKNVKSTDDNVSTPDNIVHQSLLLDAENDDDTIDIHQGRTPWDQYFEDAQPSPSVNNKKGSANNINIPTHGSKAQQESKLDCMPQAEILKYLKIQERCRSSQLTRKLESLVMEYQDRFAVYVGAMPAQIEPFRIEIDESKWEALRPEKYVRPQSQVRQVAVRNFVTKALKDGLIRSSQAKYFSQVLLTPKPNGNFRFCVDYRKLNTIVKRLSWPIPNVEALVRDIGSKHAKFFATLDYTSGYHQAPLAESSKQYTAFVTSDGVYEWNRVPMGPAGAPSYFQHEMQNSVFPDMVHRILKIYLDDIITWAQTEDELIANLRQILQRLREKNLTINPEKCKLGLEEIEYVGHVINQEGMSFSREKLNNVGNFHLPVNHKGLKSFIGLASYFRDHIKNHAEMVRPLQKLITPYQPYKRIVWTESLRRTFDNVKQSIVNCPQLFFVKEGHPIIVQTDASDYGIGAYLFQKVLNPTTKKVREQPIAFISKSFNKTQLKWSTYEKEAYAIYFALMKWEHHLRDTHFTLHTDHKNLTYLNTDLKQKVQRWKLAIQQYDFDIQHIPVRNNIVADAMSRFCDLPEDTMADKITELNMLIPTDYKSYETDIRESNQIGDSDAFSLLPAEIVDIATIYKVPQEKFKLLSKVHKTGTADQKPDTVGLTGHGGVELTIKRVKQLIEAYPEFHQFKEWKNIRQDVTNFIRQCPCCQKMARLKMPIHTRPFTVSAYGIWDCLAMDTIGPLPQSPDGYKYILTVIDSFSRYVELIPLTSTAAEPTATAFTQMLS